MRVSMPDVPPKWPVEVSPAGQTASQMPVFFGAALGSDVWGVTACSQSGVQPHDSHVCTCTQAGRVKESAVTPQPEIGMLIDCYARDLLVAIRGHPTVLAGPTPRYDTLI